MVVKLLGSLIAEWVIRNLSEGIKDLSIQKCEVEDVAKIESIEVIREDH
ncbi:MAG: hypothetical protein KF858_05110 [Candidatus Sumerlaeia bacterium]|nr:hypothetical protein [Candidatus Sumerlaeia bacterium]